jgi:hypothetical protein
MGQVWIEVEEISNIKSDSISLKGRIEFDDSTAEEDDRGKPFVSSRQRKFKLGRLLSRATRIPTRPPRLSPFYLGLPVNCLHS